MKDRRILVAGSTGATGRTMMRLAADAGAPVVGLVRPKSALRAPEHAVTVDLNDAAALAEAMTGFTTVVQTIGTMRKRFATGDTYEASDIGTTRALVEASKSAGVDHLVLLSSVGAGRPMGAYLQAKAAAERLVTESGIPFTIVRPSAFVGEEHQPPALVVSIARRLAPATYRPILLEELASALLHVAKARAPLNAVLEGASLWSEVPTAR